MNTIELPSTLHVPGTLGVSTGRGEAAASGALKLTTIGPAPSTPLAWLTGLIDIMCSGPLTGATGITAATKGSDGAAACWLTA